MDMSQIGTVTHYFDDIGVATIELSQPLALGEKVWFGNQLDGFEQTVESLQIGTESVETAEAGAVVGVEVHKSVEVGTAVYNA